MEDSVHLKDAWCRSEMSDCNYAYACLIGEWLLLPIEHRSGCSTLCEQ
jgi:hypothetical protein